LTGLKEIPILFSQKPAYNYHEYKELWWNFIQQEEFFTLVKFGNVNTATCGRPPLWLADWWKDFGLNKGAIDPRILSSFTPLSSVQDLFRQGPNDGELLRSFIFNHYQWAVKTKTIVQILNGQPFIARKIYTKCWDTLNYPERFSGFLKMIKIISKSVSVG
jgi:hypothetical protein